MPDPTVQRRRIVAGAVAAVARARRRRPPGALTGAGGGEALPAIGRRRSRRPRPGRPSFPRGGRSIFPQHRVVAYYGAPQDEELGALGIGTPASAARRLERQAKAYARPGRPVLPALELIAVIANADAGDDGMYRDAPDRRGDRPLPAAPRARPRRCCCSTSSPAPRTSSRRRRGSSAGCASRTSGSRWTPSGGCRPGQVPGQVIGRVDSREVNAVTAWLAQLTERERAARRSWS